MEHHYKLVTTADGNLYFGEYRIIPGEIIIGTINLTNCCMLYTAMKAPLDIAALGVAKERDVDVTQCVSSVSFFNPSLCIDVSAQAIESILDLIARTRNKELEGLYNQSR